MVSYADLGSRLAAHLRSIPEPLGSEMNQLLAIGRDLDAGLCARHKNTVVTLWLGGIFERASLVRAPLLQAVAAFAHAALNDVNGSPGLAADARERCEYLLANLGRTVRYCTMSLASSSTLSCSTNSAISAA